VSLAVRTFRGALWSAAGSWTQVGLNLAGVAVIARLVGPEGYGVVGLALVATGLAAMLCHGALTPSIVQHPALEDAHVDATFLLSITLSVAAAVALFAFAGPIAALLGGADGSAFALRALAPLLPLSAAAAVCAALLERDLRFRELAAAGAASSVAANLAGIAAALAGAGVWALVAMEAVRVVVLLPGLARAVRWRPGRRGTLAHLHALTGFNLRVLATQALGTADDLLPRALVGTLLGPQALGHYMLGRRIFDELSRVVTGPLAGVAMSATARARHDTALLHRIVLGLYRTASLVALPVFLGAAVLAPLAVPLAFGAAWAPAVPAVQILLLCGTRTATGVFNVSILRGLGRPDLPIRLLGAGLVLQALLIPPLAAWGLSGVALAVLLRTFATWPLGCLYVRRASGLPIRVQLAAGAPAAGAALAMAASLLALDHAWNDPVSAWLRLAAAVAAGGLLYAAALALLAPGTLHDARGLARALLRRDDRALAAGLGDTR
jgi:O-antigen/teichoic acid export membrane protein